MTHEMKYGMKMTVWMLFLYQFWNTSFRNKARITGTGNPMKTFKPLMMTVFRNTRRNSTSAIASLKCFSPTQGLPEKPSR